MSLGFITPILNYIQIELTYISLQSNTNRKKQNCVYFPIDMFIRWIHIVFKQLIINRYLNSLRPSDAYMRQ